MCKLTRTHIFSAVTKFRGTAESKEPSWQGRSKVCFELAWLPERQKQKIKAYIWPEPHQSHNLCSRVQLFGLSVSFVLLDSLPAALCTLASERRDQNSCGFSPMVKELWHIHSKEELWNTFTAIAQLQSCHDDDNLIHENRSCKIWDTDPVPQIPSGD